jgi:hypothetical protein
MVGLVGATEIVAAVLGNVARLRRPTVVQIQLAKITTYVAEKV